MSKPNPTLLTAESISLSFHQQPVLQNINLALAREQIITLIGPNGAGKSSLLKVLLGLVTPDSGTVWRKSGLKIGYMPQRLQLDPTLPITVERFLRLTRSSQHKVAAALEEVGITKLLKSPLQQVSGGELQRVLLARALLRDPDLLVLDEPTQGVDIVGQAEVYQLISAVRDRHHCGVLMVTHDLHLVMAQTDMVICLNHHVCCQGAPEQVSRDPAYIELFGKTGSESLAVYHHDHDHHHDLHGDVVDEHQHCQHD